MKNKALKILSAVFTAAVISSSHASAYNTPVDIAVNGNILKTDSAPYIDNGVTFVPVRFVSQALGCEVGWDGSNVSITNGTDSIRLTVGSRTAYVNDARRTLGTSPHIINSRTYVPVRAVCEMLGADVQWLDGYHTVSVTKSGAQVSSEHIDNSYTLDEIFWLGRIIEAESAGEPKKGKIAVGNVILNRVASREYPDTIYGVIFDRKNGTQFQPVSNGAIYNTPSGESLSSAKLALCGADEAGKSLFFLNPRISTNFWIVNNRTFFKRIGNHDFYL